MTDARIRSVLHPVGDVGAAVAFYERVLGFSVAFRDGDRYAALDAGDVKLALVSGTEDLTHRAAASIRVNDLDGTLQRVRAESGRVVVESSTGPHETRAVVADSWGNVFVLYAAT